MIPTRRRLLLKAVRLAAREVAAAPTSIGALPKALPRRGDRLVGLVTHGGLYLALAAAVGAFFSAAFGHGTWQGEARIAIGAVLAAEGLLLFTDVRGARRLLIARLHGRSVARHGPPTSIVEVLRWRLLGPLVALLSLAAICGGIVLVAMGAGDLG